MGRKASAFCPGHITAFFEICENEDVLKKGSRGAGLCLSKGVVTHIEVDEAAELEVSIRIDGERAEDSVTELAVRKMLGDEKFKVTIESENQLPVSQGFGLSGAGALSSVVALADALRSFRPRGDLIRIAHAAEVESKTGLGDIYPQALGGLTIRRSPGAPPFGRITKYRVEQEVVLCVVGEELKTKDVLLNEEVVGRICRVGGELVDSFALEPTMERLFSLSKDFALRTELASEKIARAMEESERFGLAGMSMLGNSVFAFGDTENLAGTLKKFGTIIRCQVENSGVRVLKRSEERP
jgi:pantoate kinase